MSQNIILLIKLMINLRKRNKNIDDMKKELNQNQVC